jgi:hypothetical protein
MGRHTNDQPPSSAKLTKMADREAYWLLQLALWRNSGLSIRAHCRKEKLFEAGFRLWQRRIFGSRRRGGREGIRTA